MNEQEAIIKNSPKGGYGGRVINGVCSDGIAVGTSPKQEKRNNFVLIEAKNQFDEDLMKLSERFAYEEFSTPEIYILIKDLLKKHND